VYVWECGRACIKEGLSVGGREWGGFQTVLRGAQKQKLWTGGGWGERDRHCHSKEIGDFPEGGTKSVQKKKEKRIS